MSKQLFLILLVVFSHKETHSQSFDVNLISSEGKESDTCDCHAALRTRETISFRIHLPENLWKEEKLQVTFMDDRNKKVLTKKTVRKRDFIWKDDGIYFEMPVLERNKNNRVVSHLLKVCKKKQDYQLRVLIEATRTEKIIKSGAAIPVLANSTLNGKDEGALGAFCAVGTGVFTGAIAIAYMVMNLISICY